MTADDSDEIELEDVEEVEDDEDEDDEDEATNDDNRTSCLKASSAFLLLASIVFHSTNCRNT